MIRSMSSGSSILLLLCVLAPIAVGQHEANTNSVVGLRCSTIQLLAQNGEPLKFQPVKFEREQVAVSRVHPSVVIVSFQVVKQLKTDAGGEIHLPQFQNGVYHLITEGIDVPLIELKVYSSRSFWKPAGCSQTLTTRQGRASTLSSAE